MKLRFLKGRFAGREVKINPTGFVVGRVDTADLQIDEEGISRRHCRLFYEDGTWFVEDMGSTNGIRVNGVKVTGRFAIKSGDRIGLFNQTLMFTEGGDIVDLSALAGEAVDTTSVNREPSAAERDSAMPLPPTSAAGPLSPPPASPMTERPPANDTSTPWGRIFVLLLLVALLAWFLKVTLQSEREDVKAVDAPSRRTSETMVELADDDGPDTVVIEMPGEADDLDFGEDETIPIVQVVVLDDEPEPAGVPPDDGQVGAPPAGPAVTFLVESLPVGADVVLNEIHRGKTPLLLRNVPPGRHALRLSKPGYEDMVRQIRNPDVLPEQPYAMQLKPGVLRLVSVPDGAAVLHGTQLLGTTPLVVTEMPIGAHEFQFVKFGFESTKREIAISAIEGREETVVLDTLLGGVEFITVPAGCRIYVDNLFKGMTVASDEQWRSRSRPFRVVGLAEGEHVARVEHPTGVAKSDMVRIRRGVATPVVVELWVVDTKLKLADGTLRYGMLFSVNDDGDVILTERQAGANEALPRQYLREQIAEMSAVEPAEGREVMQRLGLLKRDAQTPPDTDDATAVQGPLTIENGDVGAENEADVALRYTADQLTALIRENSATAMAKMVGGREVVLTGVPTHVSATLVRAEIRFGRTITCELDRLSYARYGHEIRTAQEQNRPITIRGRTVAHAQSVTLRNCTFVTEEVDGE